MTGSQWARAGRHYHQGNTSLAEKADDIIYVPPTLDCLTPLLTVAPLQLLA